MRLAYDQFAPENQSDAPNPDRRRRLSSSFGGGDDDDEAATLPPSVDRNWKLQTLLTPDARNTGNPKTEDFRYALVRNGVLATPVDFFPSGSANVSRAFLYDNDDNLNGSYYLIDLATVSDSNSFVLTPKRIVVPNPYAPDRLFSEHAGYYSEADSLDLCARLKAIYGTMYNVGFRVGATHDEWYQGLL